MSTATTPAAVGEVDWTDMFSGAGGDALGLEHVPGFRVTQALNHWDLAVEAHNHNFPNADHDVHDVQVIPAKRFRRTRCLWASPECTHHAYCRGPRADDPAATRSRATFGDIVRFTAFHRYDAVIVENVIEARLWCDVPGHPSRCSCGGSFDAWYAAMLALGYKGRVLYFNSQFALPTPQSRDRLYVVFWRHGLRDPNLDFRPLAWCSACEKVVEAVQSWKPPSRGGVRSQPGMFEWGRYGAQYVYRCPACGEAAAPAVTGARTIVDWSLPTQLIGEREKPLAEKTRLRIKAGMERLGSLEPVVVQVGGHLFERRPGVRVWSIEDPLRTITKTSCMALVVRTGGQSQNGHGRSSNEPMGTIIGSDRQVALVVANREHSVGGGLEEPVATVTTAPSNHLLVQVNRSTKGKPNDRQASTLGEPTRTVAGHGELALVSLRRHGGTSSSEEPAQTVVGAGNHHGLLVYNGVPGFVRELGDAAGTLTGRDKQSLLVPYYRTGVAHPTSEPMPTLTGKDRTALVVSEDEIDACSFRMLQWTELLRAQQMHEHADGRPYELTAQRRNKRGQMRELSNEQRVKMIGNAVSSPVATMLGSAIAEILSEAA